jgi:hypothetical protein
MDWPRPEFAPAATTVATPAKIFFMVPSRLRVGRATCATEKKKRLRNG